MLFLRIHNKVVSAERYFVLKKDALGVLGSTALQKTTPAMRQLCYNAPPDALDENFCISKTVAYDINVLTHGYGKHSLGCQEH